MQRIILTFSILFLFTFQIFAQPSESDRKKMQGQAKLMSSMMSSLVDSLANGKITGMSYIVDGDDPEFQTLTGTNNEQFATFYEFMMSYKSVTKPQLEPLLFRAADENDPEELAKIGTEFELIFVGIFDQIEAKLKEIVTPEQFVKMRQLELQMSRPMTEAGFPMINFEAYTALDLTPEQKKELDTIKAESLKEQHLLMDELSKLQTTPPKQGEKPEERFKKIAQKLEDGKKMTARIKSKIVAILNKEQTAKLDHLLSNIPEYVKAKMKPQQPPKPVDDKEFELWKKGWKPGDPIPAKFLQEEKARRRIFPTAG